ncbi:MAG TPA: DUF896 family protein [Cyanobacteria bacterium UBA8530]|nr:DUF896 family protein [Cyanobacteria bacterium UBA8530]
MIDPKKIERINELARKARESSLSEEEKAEQAILRREYVEAVKTNLKSSLDSLACQPDCDCGKH